MNEKREFDLLAEIAKLLRKYGSDTFRRLAADLANPDLREQIIQILVATSELAPKRKAPSEREKPNVEQKAAFRSRVSELGGQKSDLLLHFYDALEEKELMPSLSHIKMFAQDNGFQKLKAKSRDEAVFAFVEMFFPLSIAEIEELLKKITTPAPRNDRSLEAWSEVILGDEQ